VRQPTEDDLVRERFRRLREEVERSGRVPDFRAMMERARQEAAGAPPLRVLEGDAAAAPAGLVDSPGGARPRAVRRRRSVVIGGWATAAMAAALTALLLTSGRDAGDEEFDVLVAAFANDASTGAWRSPTSGLLDVPGVELLRSVPSIGGSLRGLDPARGPDAQGPEGGQDRL
jgi:hypothetical protein